ncbi:MAG: ferric reductase-like transmembrane domain-containing protein, partial [Ethanoligenens sp.]
MLLLVPVVVITALSLLCSGSIQRHPALWYFLSGVIAVLTSISVVYHDLTRTLAPGVLGILQTVSFNGYLSFAFFILVMFAGALNPRRKGVQRLLRIRAQLSIIACILVLPHVVLYLINIISSLHFILNIRGKVLALYAGYLLAGVAAFVVMLPLFITSFKKI